MFEPGHLHRSNPPGLGGQPGYSIDFYYEVRKDPSEGPMLHGREPELEEVARKLQLPSWTLRRKLAEEGTQFRTLLNETRRDLAMAYIRDTELAFGEIAFLLGFASAEAFQRAFKRWSGQTPGEFRRLQRLHAG